MSRGEVAVWNEDGVNDAGDCCLKWWKMLGCVFGGC